MAKKEKEQTLEEALAIINDKIGVNTVYVYKDFKGIEASRVSTGSLTLDYLTGGGWVYGLMNYLIGFESSGKSTACLHAIAEIQKDPRNKGKKCLYVDHEYTFDKSYAESLGVDVDNLIVSQPNTIEDGYQIVLDLLDTGLICGVMFDSVAAGIPVKELEGDVGDHTMGIKAKLNSINFPKICQKLKRSNAVGIFVNQFRQNLGGYGGLSEPGGNAVKFYPSIKIEMRRNSDKEQAKDGEVLGNHVNVKCSKNKTSAPYREGDFAIIYGKGISRSHEIMKFGQLLGLIQRNGSWFSYDDVKIGQGLTNACALLDDNPELCEELEGKIREAYGI